MGSSLTNPSLVNLLLQLSKILLPMWWLIFQNCWYHTLDYVLLNESKCKQFGAKVLIHFNASAFCYLLTSVPLKSSENLWFPDDFRGIEVNYSILKRIYVNRNIGAEMIKISIKWTNIPSQQNPAQSQR